MNKKQLMASVLAMSLLTACGGDNAPMGLTLSGNAFKGPIDGATVQVMDINDTILSNGASRLGLFNLTGITLPADAALVFIATKGGSYTDEATGGRVSPGNAGLMAVFTAADLRTAMANNQRIALTPETTIMAKLVKHFVASGDTAANALTKAQKNVQTQLIDGTNPAAMVQGDTLLTVADLSVAIPANPGEALARNRAISFSYEANGLNLTPVQVFELIDQRALDLQDGVLDGQSADGTNLSLVDKAGTSIDLTALDQKTNYGQARARLLSNTVQRLSQGGISDAEMAGLSQLGFNIDAFNQQAADNTAALALTQTRLAAMNLPAFNRLPVLTDEDGNPTDLAATYTLTATPNVNVTVNEPGGSWLTPMLRYNGTQLPVVIKAKRGDAMTLNLVNNLAAADTTIHWHGFKIPADQDGGPDFPVAAGSSKVYSFSMLQAAAPLWFHPHPDMKTGEQVYRGLTGVFLLEDDISQQLVASKQLPSGMYDIPVLVQDRRFSAAVSGVRELLYRDQPMDQNGMLGDKVLVNGNVLPKVDVETRQYRFRIYNTSNARIYDFALSDGKTFTVVGTDGGLLPSPVAVDHILLGPAERAEIVVDFSVYAVGDKVMLVSRAFNGSMMNMMGMMNGAGAGAGGGMGGMAGGSTPNGSHLDIMRFDVATSAVDDVTLYTALPSTADINTMRLQATDASKTRNFVLSMGMGGMAGGGAGGSISFMINGKVFDMNRIDEVIDLAMGDTEIWSVRNMSPMAHPFHAHAIQWQVLDRNGTAATGIDLGWKDTVLVQPGETVRIIGRFDPLVNVGKYMYHCHILEHEDAGMMGFFNIQ